jgi:5-methylcytosine-specific restriction endonuclease McrA
MLETHMAALDSRIAGFEALADEESHTAKERSEKIKCLEEKTAAEPNNWVSHFALAEFLDKCWCRYANHLRSLDEYRIRLRFQAVHRKHRITKVYEGYRRQALECYFKAIALGIDHAYFSACAKLGYALLLAEERRAERPDSAEERLDSALAESNAYKHIGPLLESSRYSEVSVEQHETIRHYAREAEKDLRKRLQKYPDDIPALRKLGQAVALHQENDRVRSERLTAIDARIAEAEMRKQMRVAPSSQLGAPGAPESPYPDNWKRLSEAAKHRDGHKCTDCGASGVELHVHHVVPLSKGGTNDLDNLATLCSMCHSMIHPRMGDAP